MSTVPSEQLVAGVDSSTQSCKVVVREARTGRLVRRGSAPHPDGTEVDPEAWWQALQQAADAAGGLDDVDAVAVAGQQHGMVCLDASGATVRDALLWNDTRSAVAAEQLVAELGAAEWARRVGVVPVASFTVTKLRWLAEHEPANAARTAAVCLPHDWLTWRLSGSTDIATLATDRSDASGTGYFDSTDDAYCADLLELGLGRADVVLPQVLGPRDARPGRGLLLAAGAGDNAAAALGVAAGDRTVVSLGTSGVVSARRDARPVDPSGTVAGFADATGAFLPLVCTLNAARVLDVVAGMLGVDRETFDTLALSAPPGAEGVLLLPYLEGERTPNLPLATGSLLGLTLANATPANIARAAVEGMLCGVAAGLDALEQEAPGDADRHAEVLLIGGAAASRAVQHLAPAVLGRPVVVPAPAEYVADGAARQAAEALLGDDTAWPEPPATPPREPPATDQVLLERHRAARDLHLERRS